MANEPMYTIEQSSRERAILVGIEQAGSKWSMESSLQELSRLADTAGADTVGITSQKLTSPNPRTFVGSGKATQLVNMAGELDADIIIFDDELTPSQQSNLEKLVGRNVKVIDRTALILDIFALHAKTREGRLQVQLAQNEYLYPRLRGMWAHLASNRMGGGVGSRFGEGESQLEVDRRMVRKRITSIRRELEHLSRIRGVQRESRYNSGIFKIALVGYTNAGKSSLLNRLTDSNVYADDKLFATLDSTTRKLILPEGREVTLSDTVGFIQKLPTTLVEAFKSTLDEITNSDLILHVVDASSNSYEQQVDAVNDVLGQIGAESIPKLTVFNKCDLLDSTAQQALAFRNSMSIQVSAVMETGIDELITRIVSAAAATDSNMHVLIPYSRGELVSLAHKRCRISNESHTELGTSLILRVPIGLEREFKPFLITS
ncbi:GTPase HflX [Adlercreutzia sp. ZJ304]|uniref:GTPase HflX n=1 Tax=Adlercreutzia sp. ZJ304 TaxID=2709791 RepID=UPI0013EA4653|nr:GTPase HflX [Adlercreutzia sp. ZJ304]